MLEKIKQRIYDVLIDTDDNERIDKIIAFALMILIVLNVVAVLLETVNEYQEAYGSYFEAFELFSVAVFTIEYVLRLWIAPLDKRYRGSIRGRIRYALTPMALIDLAAILPAFLPLVLAMDLRMVRILRIFRLFRLMKLSRYVQSLDTLDDVIRSRKEELLVTTVMIVMLLLFAASLMYVVEHEAQPEKFTDIPTALWWGIATLTTVGYGDVFPITPLGKLFGGLIAFLGIGIFALPTGIIASGFAEEIQKKRAKLPVACPHCGRTI